MFEKQTCYVLVRNIDATYKIIRINVAPSRKGHL